MLAGLSVLVGLTGCGGSGSGSSTAAGPPVSSAPATSSPAPTTTTASGTTTGGGSTTIHPAPGAAKHRRAAPGTISNDQVGESVLALTYAQLRHRFGPPAGVSRDGSGNRCLFYEVITSPGRGWRFCFRGATMVSATGNQPRPGPVR
jgi:hypothetical protein